MESVNPGGFISYLSGKFIYTYYVNHSGDDSGMADARRDNSHSVLCAHPAASIPRNGEIMWDYQQMRAPLNLQFNGNTIELVFKKEVQVLKFLSL